MVAARQAVDRGPAPLRRPDLLRESAHATVPHQIAQVQLGAHAHAKKCLARGVSRVRATCGTLWRFLEVNRSRCGAVLVWTSRARAQASTLRVSGTRQVRSLQKGSLQELKGDGRISVQDLVTRFFCGPHTIIIGFWGISTKGAL